MARHQSQSTFLRSAFALIALFAFAMIPTGCSTQKDSLPEVASANDYIAQGQNDSYAYGFGSYGPCMAYDPYCSALHWYPVPVHYYLRGDGDDNDCDDRNRGGSNGASHHKPTAGGGFRGGRGGGRR
jgi:hypothetical protein